MPEEEHNDLHRHTPLKMCCDDVPTGLRGEKIEHDRHGDFEALGEHYDKQFLDRSSRRTLLLAIAVLGTILLSQTHLRACILGGPARPPQMQLPVPWLQRFVEPFDGEGGQKRPLSGRDIEDSFTSVPNVDSARKSSRQFSREPHVAGTTQDFITAKEMLQIFQDALGISPPSQEPIYSAGSSESRQATLSISSSAGDKPRAWIDTYYPILNYPVDSAVQILDENEDILWSANLYEHADSEEDADAWRFAGEVPAFHGYSRDGDVQGKLVYANFGRKEDYDKLTLDGVDVNGTLVIVRNGGNLFRGIKVNEAQKRGAVGCLIYSDPDYDGDVTTKNGFAPYPHGPARNPDSYERGSVQLLPLYPGDPTTLGYPSYENATRMDGGSLPTIPSLPISFNNARRLLQESEGKTVRLLNKVDYEITPIWNTMAVIPGHIADEVVILGNHRDAWGVGASDPVSGTVSLVEIARGLGFLVKTGWKPLRTIVLASWDAEEYGLIGSTEWGEDFADWIQEHVVAYINVDTASAGSMFIAQGSTSLGHMLVDVAHEVPHPTDPTRNLWDARSDEGPFGKNISGAARQPSYTRGQPRSAIASNGISKDTLYIKDLGSGSDFTVFLHHLGVSSAVGHFRNSWTDAVKPYHSVFDTFTWQERYGDPGFKRTVTIAKFLGKSLLRLAESTVLPFNTTQYTHHLDWYIDKAEVSAQTAGIDVNLVPLRIKVEILRDASISLDREKIDAEYELARLMQEWTLAKNLGISEQTYLSSWFGITLTSTDYHRRQCLLKEELTEAAERVRRVNAKLYRFERGFISEEGLKGRPWYRHLGAAPDIHRGYATMSFPGLHEAIEYDRDEKRVREELNKLEELVEGLIGRIAL